MYILIEEITHSLQRFSIPIKKIIGYTSDKETIEKYIKDFGNAKKYSYETIKELRPTKTTFEVMP
jgi:DNA polymerase I-like protein with 3'-5' exonuclease and polymerase domains